MLANQASLGGLLRYTGKIKSGSHVSSLSYGNLFSFEPKVVKIRGKFLIQSYSTMIFIFGSYKRQSESF